MISGGLTPAKVDQYKGMLCQAKAQNQEWQTKCEAIITQRSGENPSNDLDESAYTAVANRCEVDAWETKTAITAKCAYYIMAEEPNGKKYLHGDRNANASHYSHFLDYADVAQAVGIQASGKSFTDFVTAAADSTTQGNQNADSQTGGEAPPANAGAEAEVSDAAAQTLEVVEAGVAAAVADAPAPADAPPQITTQGVADTKITGGNDTRNIEKVKNYQTSITDLINGGEFARAHTELGLLESFRKTIDPKDTALGNSALQIWTDLNASLEKAEQDLGDVIALVSETDPKKFLERVTKHSKTAKEGIKNSGLKNSSTILVALRKSIVGNTSVNSSGEYGQAVDIYNDTLEYYSQASRANEQTGNYATTRPHPAKGSLELLYVPQPLDDLEEINLTGGFEIPVGESLTLKLAGAYGKGPYINRSYGEDFALIAASQPEKNKTNLFASLLFKTKFDLDSSEKEEQILNLSVDGGQIKRPALGPTLGVNLGLKTSFLEDTLTLGASALLGSETSFPNLADPTGREFNQGDFGLQTVGFSVGYNPTDWLATEAGLASESASKVLGYPDTKVFSAKVATTHFVDALKITPELSLESTLNDQEKFNGWSLGTTLAYGNFSLHGAYTFLDGWAGPQGEIQTDSSNSLDEPATGDVFIGGPLTYLMSQDQKTFSLEAGLQLSEDTTVVAGWRWNLLQEEQEVSFPGGSDDFENTAGTKSSVFAKLTKTF